MAVDSSLLQILSSLPIEDKEAMRIGSASTVTSTNEFDVSLSTNGTTVIRRLPFNYDLNKLDDWKETAGVVFHRFLQDKPFFFSFADVEGSSSILDSDEKIETVLKLHKQKCSIEPVSSLPLQLKLEIIENSSSSSLPEATEPFVKEECATNKDLVTCECDGCGQMVTMGLGYKCLDCNNVHICENCETMNEKHNTHLLIPCLVLILGAEHNYIVKQADGLIQLVSGNENEDQIDGI
ncbi:hypothetical protein DAPPUDRAFT_306281 [Daphnia pulex]|uniref:ZZ-type domain-containing protein n=1 Tax=Daphnia pulex TaxID=6669 RepID=E9GWA1_DAPPU|nr:hypothetical protein DAPPUDRAFT_306281 [Daphnia pulex]|eukprot:EFX76233.1 hypothetical protein DAPPUDRAFT_306281 [Daphnia pulex]